MTKKSSKEQRIKAEYSRLSEYFQGVSVKQRATVEHLIQNCAFLAVTLQDLQQVINKNGVVDTYKNGENQYGIKQSAELQAYNQTFKSYQTAIKQLLNLLPVKSTAGDRTGLSAIIARTLSDIEDAEN